MKLLSVAALLLLALPAPASSIAEILQAGETNLRWLSREKLVIRDEEFPRSFPIEHPSIYSESTLVQDFDDFRKEMPEFYFKVVSKNAAIPDSFPISKKEFLKLAVRMNYLYVDTKRWLDNVKDIEKYKSKKKSDIRGYYFLSREKDINAKLQNWKTLSGETQNRIFENLVGICINSYGVDAHGNDPICRGYLTKQLEAGETPTAFYNMYIDVARQNFDLYFELVRPRRGLTWIDRGTQEKLILPIYDQSGKLTPKMKSKIESLWTWGPWHLELVPDTNAEVTLKSEAGTLVSRQQKNEILIDSDNAFSEFRQQKVLAHELGHVLGFPDCYAEFFEGDTAQDGHFVYYELDTTNLMCSSTGHVLQSHYEAIKRTYLPKSR